MSFHARDLELGAIELKSADDADMVTKALDGLTASVKAVEQKLADRVDALEAKMNRPAPGVAGDDQAEVETKAFETFIRTNDATELKTLSFAAPSTGGILAPPTFVASVLEKVAEFSPVRGLAQSMRMGGSLLQFPRLVDEVDPAYVAEGGTKSSDEPTFEQLDLKAYEQAVIVPVSQILLEDSAIDLSAFIAAHLGRKFGQLESRSFVIGNGTTAPQGLLTSTEVGVVDAADAEQITGDELIDLFYSIKSAYSARGTWLMNRSTMATVRKLKNLQGDYLWQPSIAAGAPPTILGRPVVEAVDMPSIAAEATPILFGDLATGYLIADRVDLDVQTDRVTAFSTGVVKIGARRRVGGRVMMGEALAKLKLAAS